ncbi:MAG: hypothetical protein ACRBBU_08415 [Pseudooceanicola sp.]
MTIQKGDLADPKGLIREAYRIDAITAAECRSIFVDWALSLSDGMTAQDAMAHLIALYGQDAPDHPMSVILREGRDGAVEAAKRGRRGGRRGRGQ